MIRSYRPRLAARQRRRTPLRTNLGSTTRSQTTAGELPNVRFNMETQALRAQLQALLGDTKVLTDEASLTSHSHDYWLLDLQKRIHGDKMPMPSCVVQPATTAEVAAVLAFANKEGIPVVPYGAGYGVCGAAKPSEGAIVLDTQKMSRLLDLNEVALTVTVEPGMIGKDLEAELTSRGYSMGHFPQSMNLSSVGGWVATRASGQFSTKYGSIEDMLICLKAVLADGTVIETKNVPRTAIGSSVNELFLGSEGTLGVITEITYKIHPLPEQKIWSAFEFATFAQGLEAVRKIMRAGWKPALVRLYDPSETKRHFAKEAAKDTCLLLILSEGPAPLAEIELAGCRTICTTHGGVDKGSELVTHWLEHRFEFPDPQELAETKGLIFDTIEVAANWDYIEALYESVIAALKTVPGIVNASAHSSHSYQQGTCLYFTFAVLKPHWLIKQAVQYTNPFGWGRFNSPTHVDIVERTYNECWQKVMEVVLNNHGTISHHHGIGKVRLPWLARELPTALVVLEQVKKALDPNRILNPGNLL